MKNKENILEFASVNMLQTFNQPAMSFVGHPRRASGDDKQIDLEERESVKLNMSINAMTYKKKNPLGII